MATQIQTNEELIAHFIERNPRKPGLANARLRDYGVSVWALIATWKAAKGDTEQVARDYGIPLKAMQAALAYYRQHPAVIDDRMVVA